MAERVECKAQIFRKISLDEDGAMPFSSTAQMVINCANCSLGRIPLEGTSGNVTSDQIALNREAKQILLQQHEGEDVILPETLRPLGI